MILIFFKLLFFFSKPNVLGKSGCWLLLLSMLLLKFFFYQVWHKGTKLEISIVIFFKDQPYTARSVRYMRSQLDRPKFNKPIPIRLQCYLQLPAGLWLRPLCLLNWNSRKRHDQEICVLTSQSTIFSKIFTTLWSWATLTIRENRENTKSVDCVLFLQ